MNAKAVYNRIKQLITYPTREWQQIKKESSGAPALIGYYLVPVLLIYFIFSLLGNVIFTNDIEHTTLYKISYVFGRLLLILTGFLMSFIIILKLFKKMEVDVSTEKMFTLIFYSYLIIWIVASFMGLLSNYKSLIRFLHVFSLYGLVLFWIGSEALIAPAKEKRKSLYAWSFIILTAIYLLMFFMLKKLISFLMIIHLFSQF
jgi:hypothetical protein